MSKIYNDITECIGHTPLVRIDRMRDSLIKSENPPVIMAKLEYFNPAGSAKDRIAVHIIDKAVERGELKPGGTIIEPTSGNTGIGIACVAAARGYHAIIVMPDSMSVERQKLMTGYGAELVLTPGAKGMSGAIEEAEKIKAKTKGAVIAGQFDNPDNSESHYLTTGPEIWEDAGGNVDVFIATVGTGGTITGTGRYLKEKNPHIEIVAVEPEGSPVLSGGQAGSHKIQGIGAGFVPKALDTSVYDKVVMCPDDEAFRYSKMLAASEGILVGISSGAGLYAAAKLASDPAYAGKNIVVFLTDTGERYLSTELF